MHSVTKFIWKFDGESICTMYGLVLIISNHIVSQNVKNFRYDLMRLFFMKIECSMFLKLYHLLNHFINFRNLYLAHDKEKKKRICFPQNFTN